MAASLDIKMENALEAIPSTLDRVEAHLDALGASGPTRFEIMMSIEELLSNIVRYAWPEGGRHEIDLRLERRGDAIHCRLSDSGRPFDPLSLATPDVDAPLEERAIGGLGIHLVREAMHEVAYAREDGHNVLRLVRELGA